MEIWEEDLYDLLNVQSEATPDEIKKAYKKLSREWHPDRFPDDEAKRLEAQSVFGKITNAYNILKDEEERAEYDFARRMGAVGATSGHVPTGGGGKAPAPPPRTAEQDDAVNEAKKSQAENQFAQGKVYHRGKNWQKAISCYKEASRLDPTQADYFAYLGVAYKQQGLMTPANSAFATAYKLDKKNKLVHEHYDIPGEGKSKNGGKPGLLDQIMAFFNGGGKPDPKGKSGAKGKPGAKGKGKGTASLKKAGAKK